MSPPIRAPGHGKALQAALSTGVLQVSPLIRLLKIIVFIVVKFKTLIFVRADCRLPAKTFIKSLVYKLYCIYINVGVIPCSQGSDLHFWCNSCHDLFYFT